MFGLDFVLRGAGGFGWIYVPSGDWLSLCDVALVRSRFLFIGGRTIIPDILIVL